MDLTVVQGGERISIAFPVVADGFGSQLLDGNKYADTISNFLDAHLFEHDLITLNEIIAGDVVDCRKS